MQQWQWDLLLIPIGFLAGVVNTIAGGGSFLTLPALMVFGGLDAKLANGTNRVAILFSSVSATRTFRKHGLWDRQLIVRLTLPMLAGVLLGSRLAIVLEPHLFKRVFGALFLAMAVVVWRKPQLLTQSDRQAANSRIGEALLFLAIGVYVGFIQAGMGLLLLLGIGLFHAQGLVNANAVKNAVGVIVTTLALAVFAYYDQIRWRPGLIMAVGNMLGGIVGARLALKKGQRLVFAILIVVMVATGLKLLLS